MQSDRDLVRRAQQGDRQADGIIVQRYQRAALAVAQHVLHESHAAEDAAQEAFVAAYRGLSAIRSGSRFGAWLLKIVQRESTRIAKRRRRTLTLEAEVCPAGGGLRAVRERNGALDQDSYDVLAAVDRLPFHERAVVFLRYFDG